MKGICFKEPLFHLTIDGWKTQTRRILQIPSNAYGGLQIQRRAIDGLFWGLYALDENERAIKPGTEEEWKLNPKYKTGEKVFLKEPYRYRDICEYGRLVERIEYRFDNSTAQSQDIEWKNKLFMPTDAARHFILITDVRAECLQDITDEDCLKEGIIEERPEFYDLSPEDGKPQYGIPEMIPNTTSVFATRWFDSPREAYAALINSINGKGTWDSNPVVWVYNYELQ